jgi:hypothetical protein
MIQEDPSAVEAGERRASGKLVARAKTAAPGESVVGGQGERVVWGDGGPV